ncbi:MAG: HTH domain-containing protein, partial [Holdemania filiformis]
MSRKNELILNQLSSALMKNDDFLSALSLSKMLNVSETVIRKKVDEMNEMLVQAHLGSIEKKPRKGIRLI